MKKERPGQVTEKKEGGEKTRGGVERRGMNVMLAQSNGKRRGKEGGEVEVDMTLC